MQLILKNREYRKVPQLKEILNKFIAIRHREQAEKRLEIKLYNNARAFITALIRKKYLDIHKYEMVNDKAEEILQVFENNGNNLERFGMKLDKVLEPVNKK